MKESEAKQLLRKALPFLDSGQECIVCGSRHDIPHELDCFVPDIERILDIKLTARGGK